VMLNSDLSRLIIGFILAALVSTLFVQWYQDRNLEKQRQFEVMKRRLDEGQNFIEELSDFMNLRVAQMRHVEKLLYSRDYDARKETLRAWYETADARQRWNAKLGVYQNKATRLISPGIGMKLNNFETENSALTNPGSINGHFFVCNRAFTDVMKCLKDSECKPSETELKDVHERLIQLDNAVDSFVDEASSVLLATKKKE
jgi:hypothetical protein